MKIKGENQKTCRVLLLMGFCLSNVCLCMTGNGDYGNNMYAAEAPTIVSQVRFKVTGVVKDSKSPL